MKSKKRQVLNLDGGDWKIRGFDPGAGVKAGVYGENASQKGWITARVPGNVQLDVFHHQCPDRDIFYNDGVEQVQWTERKEWWYRKSVQVPADWKDTETFLTFKGVDFRAVFWLNGHKLGEHIGMFTPVEFRVTPYLKPGKRNTLVVQIKPVPHGLPLKSRAEEYDWAIYVMTTGLWKGVELVSVPYARVRALLVDTDLTRGNRRARVKLRVRIDNPPKRPFQVKAQIVDPTEGTTVASVESSPARFKVGDEVVLETDLDNPKLWWPRGHGEPFLYEARVSLIDPTTRRRVDHFATDFGVRSIKMLPNPGKGQKKEDWVLTVNGRRVFIRGMNFLPAEQFFGRLKDRTYHRLIERAAHMGCNMFRIWGGGLIESEAFYYWCNRLGIMVVQEMIFANQYERVTDRGILEMVSREIPRILEKVHNHPSMVMLNGGNEMPHYPEVREICERLEPTRPFFKDTGFHSPWSHQFPNDYAWWNRNRSNMHGECCVSGCFNLETVDRYIPKEEITFPIPEPPLACEHRFRPVRARRVRMHISAVQRGLNARNDIKEIYNLKFEKLSGELYGEGNSQYPVVDSIEVFTTSGENLALSRKGARAKASSSLVSPKICHVGPHPEETIGGRPEKVINGYYGNEHSWAGAKRCAPIHYHPYAKNSNWIEIELPEEVTIDRIVWSRDRTGHCLNNVPIGYKFMVAGRDGKFRTVVEESGDGGKPYFNKNTGWAYHRGFYGYWSWDSWFENRNLELQFGPLKDMGSLENYVLASQLVHGAIMRYIAESFRRRKYESGGGFLWTLDEPWPNAAFCNLIDYYGVPKAAYYFVRRAYEPVHIGAEIAGVMLDRHDNFRARLWASHESREPLTGVKYAARLVRISDGALIGSASGSLSLGADQSKYFRAFQTSLKRTREGDILGLFLRLVDSRGEVLSRNTYLFGVCERCSYPEKFFYPPHYLMCEDTAVDFECSSPPFRRFFDQPPASLRVSVGRLARTAEGWACTVRIRNGGKKPAVLVSCRVKNALPEAVRYEDNYVDLLPGESTAVGVTVLRHPGQTSPGGWTLEIGGVNVPKQEFALNSR